jgi:signal transduction histidine kinase
VVAFLVGIVAIGLMDYATGPEIGLAPLYLAPICVIAWWEGPRAGLAAAICAASVWLAADMAAHQYSHAAIAYWNGFVRLLTFSMISLLLSRVRALTESLRRRLGEKSAALVDEIDRHEQTRDALEHSEEREMQRIGSELHDTLGQELTGLALLSKELEERLLERRLPESSLAAKVTRSANETMGLMQSLVRGLCPVEAESGGLCAALERLAEDSGDRFRIRCDFRYRGPAWPPRPDVDLHLYRIAQEAVTNAVKHGKARTVLVSLSAEDGQCTLRVEDDGKGTAGGVFRKSGGSGVAIMQYRARSVGGRLALEPVSPSGTAVVCCVPAASAGRQHPAETTSREG